MKKGVGVAGAGGDMGIRVARLLDLNSRLFYKVGLDSVSGENIVSNAAEMKDIDGIIDFSSPVLALRSAKRAVELSIPFVSGTTGFTEEQYEQLRSYSKNIPILHSPNMSVGVNVMFSAARFLAEQLKDFDLEIMEIHHSRKADSPSGTALKLWESASCGREMKKVDGRSGAVGPRDKNEFGIMSIRGGDVAGEHTLFLMGKGERLELTHRVSDRDNFAVGAIKCLRFLFDKPAGFYEMKDMLSE